MQHPCQHLYSRSENSLDNNGRRNYVGGIKRVVEQERNIETVWYLWHAFRTQETREKEDLIRDIYPRHSLHHWYRFLAKMGTPAIFNWKYSFVQRKPMKMASSRLNEWQKFTSKAEIRIKVRTLIAKFLHL